MTTKGNTGITQQGTINSYERSSAITIPVKHAHASFESLTGYTLEESESEA